MSLRRALSALWTHEILRLGDRHEKKQSDRWHSVINEVCFVFVISYSHCLHCRNLASADQYFQILVVSFAWSGTRHVASAQDVISYKGHRAIKDEQDEQRLFEHRAWVGFVCIALCLLALIGRYVWMQALCRRHGRSLKKCFGSIRDCRFVIAFRFVAVIELITDVECSYV